ncbi:hypothetical protein SCE1572_36470 [Sorangium cellulosum So0157-2]|uniref:Uncharacterized protein n=1 Tax=Sorangium cellulosum So0157-2 TaxID=1254432 RepID=S4Y207_SORCE|nr:hypothetical protein SCE1572_36470 [Sorangium cellulosum So0157-2]
MMSSTVEGAAAVLQEVGLVLAHAGGPPHSPSTPGAWRPPALVADDERPMSDTARN